MDDSDFSPKLTGEPRPLKTINEVYVEQWSPLPGAPSTGHLTWDYRVEIMGLIPKAW